MADPFEEAEKFMQQLLLMQLDQMDGLRKMETRWA